jgi:peptidoglycan/LPS O-acetylase OafA/YrhL
VPGIKSKIGSIQILRGVAASMVVMDHVAWSIAKYHGGSFPLDRLDFQNFGAAGVDIFFVISGFIMFVTTKSVKGGFHDAKHFLFKRVVRIYPTYWIWSALLLCLFVAHLAFRNHSPSTGYLLSSFFLWPYKNQDGDFHPWMSQGWTLTFEMYFYIVFSLMLFLKLAVNRLGFLFGVFLSLHCVGLYIGPETSVGYIFSFPLVFEFIFVGVAAGVMLNISARSRTFDNRFLLLGLILFFGLLFAAPGSGEHGPDQYRLFVFGIPAFFIVLLSCLLDLKSNFLTRALMYLGNASYSIYLTHFFLILLLETILKKGLLLDVSSDILYVISVSAIIGLSSLAYPIIERPISQFFKLRFEGRSTLLGLEKAGPPHLQGVAGVAQIDVQVDSH